MGQWKQGPRLPAGPVAEDGRQSGRVRRAVPLRRMAGCPAGCAGWSRSGGWWAVRPVRRVVNHPAMRAKPCGLGQNEVLPLQILFQSRSIQALGLKGGDVFRVRLPAAIQPDVAAPGEDYERIADQHG